MTNQPNSEALTSESRALTRVPAVSYKHLQAKMNFRLRAQPLGANMVPWLFKPREVSIDVGRLIDLIAREMARVTGIVNTNSFTLVNVLSSRSMSSIGFYEGPPPESSMPAVSAQLCFTFALAPDVNWNSVVITDRVFKDGHVTTFNTDFSPRPQFLNIAIPIAEAQDMGLVNLTWARLQYLYYTVGMITKNLVVRQRSMIRPSVDQVSHPDNPVPTYENVEYRSLAELPNRIKYMNWCFSEELLDRAPNLLSSRHITGAFVRFLVTRNLLQKVDLPLYLQVHLDQFVIDMVGTFVGMCQKPLERNISPFEALLPVMIYSIADSGVAPDLRYLSNADLEQFGERLIRRMTMRAQDVSRILSPQREVALDIAAGRFDALYALSSIYHSLDPTKYD